MQDRLTYANGNTITTEGFKCTIGEPIDIKVTVGEDEEVEIPYAAGKIIPNGDYLITLDVNGEKAAYRDLYHLTYGGEATVIGDYTISDDLFLTGVSEDDEVVMRLEPVELIVTDAFRAAVSKTAPQSGGGSGGGVLVVNVEEDDNGKYILDKTWQEIYGSDADAIIVRYDTEDGKNRWNAVGVYSSSTSMGETVPYRVACFAGTDIVSFTTNTADGYPKTSSLN